MSKLTLNNVADLRNSTTAAATINNNNDLIELALENTLSLDGTSPNEMQSDLDMNSKQVLNLPQPATANSALRLQDLNDFVGGGTVTNIPVGGDAADILTKSSSADYDVEWENIGTILASVGSTGTGVVVLQTSPTITTPHISSIVNTGTLTLPTSTDTLIGKATTDTLTNKTFDTAGTGNSLSINGVAATANTGTGAVVRASSPTLTTPALGTPSAIVLTSGTGLPVSTGISGLGTGVATFLATPSSANLGTALTDKTGTGVNVFATTPTLVTPVLGVATATSVNKVAITAPASSATLTIPDGVTLTGPASSGTAMTLGNTETVTGIKTFGSAGAVGRLKVAGTTSGSTVLDATATASGTLTLPAATDTLVGKATTDTFTNKTYNSSGTGNVFQIAGNTVTTVASLAALPTSNTRQVFSSGTAATYTTPTNCKYINIRAVGGGGSGGGAGAGAVAGVTGNNTTFSGGSGGTAISITASGGGSGSTFINAGGAATGGDINIPGGAGSAGGNTAQLAGSGGNSAFGGGGGASIAAGQAGGNGAANSGGGGGGGSAGAAAGGGGGGAGGYVELLKTSLASTYTYTVGAATTGGAAGSGGTAGGNGAAGLIIVDEFYI